MSSTDAHPADGNRRSSEKMFKAEPLNSMDSIEVMDEAALLACGYKQEFKRWMSFAA